MVNCNLWFKPRPSLPAILAVSFLLAAGTADRVTAEASPQVHSNPSRICPAAGELDRTLGEASNLMEQSRFQDAIALLQPASAGNCNPRVSLLLAAALEGGGDTPAATTALEHAHSVWPANNSVAASLARIYLANGQNGKALQALARFHATAQTPGQEMEMAVVVYLAAQRLVSAQKIAEQNYKYYPSVHSLLLLANTLQMQGRYPDVNRLLGAQRAMYADSPDFLVTLAESEFDASIFLAARQDLQRAISLNPGMYQAHYLLGNVLAKANDTEGAIAEYRRAIELAPEQPRTYYQLALVLRAKQDDAGEQHILEQALAADNQYAPAHCEMGRILLEDHRPADAVVHLLAAVQYNPRSEEAYFLLARAYAALGDRDKSNAMVKRLEAVRQENRPGPNNRAARVSIAEPSTSQ